MGRMLKMSSGQAGSRNHNTILVNVFQHAGIGLVEKKRNPKGILRLLAVILPRDAA